MTRAEAAWFRYSAGTPDYCLYCHNIVFLLVVYTLAPLPLALLELRAPATLTSPYKLQPRVRLSPAAFFRCYKDTARVLLLTVGALQLVSYPAVKMVGIRTGLPLPSLGETAAQLVVYLLVEDYLGYWIHRLLHTEWGYSKIHHVHHQYMAPIGFAAPYAHWAETRRSRRHPQRFIPFYGGAQYHDYHHYVGRHSQSNFASVFTICDYVYGTDKGYRYHKASTLAKLKRDTMASDAFSIGKQD
ncbi:hypothetical protein QOZ80_3BG0297320 [Eleusine coracana subsp. coracana]|nr:hypothetical protein QOZ80_3BG0297320 [Eleusine coracana subsp. coracana]